MTLRPVYCAVAASIVLAGPAAAQMRVITGPGIGTAPTHQGAPQRVEPPRAPAKPPAPIVARRLGPVVIESAAQLRAGRLTVHIDGVEALERDETCRDDDGHEWACGRRGLAAIRAMVRLRPVACPLPADARGGAFDAACTLGGSDLGERFVAAGWARARADGPLVAAEATARAERRGIWGPAPPVVSLAAMPEPTAEGLPPDRTTAPLGADAAAEAPRDAPTAPSAAGAPMVLDRRDPTPSIAIRP